MAASNLSENRHWAGRPAYNNNMKGGGGGLFEDTTFKTREGCPPSKIPDN